MLVCGPAEAAPAAAAATAAASAAAAAAAAAMCGGTAVELPFFSPLLRPEFSSLPIFEIRANVSGSLAPPLTMEASSHGIMPSEGGGTVGA